MKIKRISKASVIEWLKRIFTLQSLAVIAGFIAAFYTYKTYKDNQPAHISLEYSEGYEAVNVEDKDILINLSSSSLGKVFFRSLNPDDKHPIGLPIIVNKSSKSVENLNLEVSINTGFFEFKEEDVGIDFEIIDNNPTIQNAITLRYKNNYLNANSEIPVPLWFLYVPDTILIPKVYDSCETVSYAKDDCISSVFQYKITYDGLSKPIEFVVVDYVYIGEYRPWLLSDEQIDKFLTMCYERGCFTELKNRIIVSVLDRNPMIVIPPKKLSDADFKEFKRGFVEKRKDNREWAN